MVYRILQIVAAIWMFFGNPVSVFADREMPPTRPLSDSSFITLLTCDPGEELYATFGHSAIRVCDSQQHLDWVFNYGTFNFNVPHFYAKFASGKLLYKLSFSGYAWFLREYQYTKRRVIEEQLNLTQSERQKLFNYLKENYKPENRQYQYDFFFDNCATRILDIFYDALGDSLVYYAASNSVEPTFRHLISQNLVKSQWSEFGIDLALGAVIDQPATPREQAFLPDYLSLYCNHCQLNGKPFILETKTVVSDSAPIPKTPFLLSPQFWFWILFLIVALFSVLFPKKNWMMADRIIFGIFGLTGVIVLLLWVATDHDATANNLNVLWANPLYLVYLFLIRRKPTRIFKWAAITVLILNLSVLLGWFVIPQQFNPVFIPLIGILVIRSFAHVVKDPQLNQVSISESR